MQKYTKFLIALAGVTIPFLSEVGVPLPEFLTVGWVEGIVLALTPALVFWFPNKNSDGSNAIARSPALAGVIALVIGSLALGGCSTMTVAEGIASASAEIESLAETVKDACGNTVPDGPCRPGALIDTETKQDIKADLGRALDALQDANELLAADEVGRADGALSRAESILLTVAAIMAERGL